MSRKFKYALITGASSGLGIEFARQLAAEGFVPILVARRKERMIELARELESQYEIECTIIKADLSRKSECRRVFRLIESKPIGIVINNAGFGDCSPFIEGDLDKETSMIDVNITAVHMLTKLALLKFKKQRGGYLLNVASSAGLFPAGPYMATYYATKSYVTSLTQAIDTELREMHYSHIHVSALCPGPIDTEFNSVANVEFALKGITAEDCVADAIKGMKHNRVLIVPTLRMKAAIFASKFIPRSILVRLTGHQQKKKFSQLGR